MNQSRGEILINFWFKIPLQIRYLWALSAGVELWSCLMPQVTLSAESWASAMFYYSFVAEKILTSLYTMFYMKIKEPIPFSQCNWAPRCLFYSFNNWIKEWSAKRWLTHLWWWTILDTSLCPQKQQKACSLKKHVPAGTYSVVSNLKSPGRW